MYIHHLNHTALTKEDRSFEGFMIERFVSERDPNSVYPFKQALGITYITYTG